MALRDNVKIKTKYRSLEDCVENCLDYKGESIFYSTFSRGIGGIMTDDGDFVISTKNRGSGLFQYAGSVVEENGEIYLVGNISVKPLQMAIITFMIIFMVILGILITVFMQPLGVFVGILFIFFPSFNLIYIKRSNALYYQIVKKVS